MRDIGYADSPAQLLSGWLAVLHAPAGAIQEFEAPGSAFDRLLEQVEHHVQSEAESIRSYRRLEDQTTDPVVAMLMQQIVDDEERHHIILGRLAATLRDALRWSDSPEGLVTDAREHASEEMLAAIGAAIRAERQEARSFQELARQERTLHDGLFSLLLELVAIDSQKHTRILEFIEKRMGANH